MKYLYGEQSSFPDLCRSNLRADCENCFGFCCAALYFSASDGFPVDKKAEEPCPNLQLDFKCRVYKCLGKLGLKGCGAYDCLGAGQKVAQITFGGRDWLRFRETANQMFGSFVTVRQIHEIMWYLAEAFFLSETGDMKDEIAALNGELERIPYKDAESLLRIDVERYHAAANALMRRTSERVRKDFHVGKSFAGRHKTDLIGADLKDMDLRGADFRGALLIAADLREADLSGVDFIGADLRDADIRGANLSHSIFLTQMQVNTAKGDAGTKLPAFIDRPSAWLSVQPSA